MAIGRDRLAELLSRLVSASLEERERAAENVSDWKASVDSFEAKILVRTMASIISFEENSVSREAEMNALVNIFDPASMNFHDVEPVLNLDRENLGVSEREYVVELRKLLG